MWKPVLIAVCVGALAGCIAIEVTETPDARPAGGAMTCDASQYQYLIGQTEGQIDHTRLPSASRVICAGCMATMDYNPNRLNIQMSPNKRVGSVRCG